MSAPPHARTALAAGLARLVRLAALALLLLFGVQGVLARALSFGSVSKRRAA